MTNGLTHSDKLLGAVFCTLCSSGEAGAEAEVETVADGAEAAASALLLCRRRRRRRRRPL